MFNPELWLLNRHNQQLFEPPEGVEPTAGLDRGLSLVEGFAVEALDGSLGHVAATFEENGLGRLIVDTGPWIFGSEVVLPAGVIDRIDPVDRKVYVRRTKDEIKAAPRNIDAPDEEYLHRLGAYYDKGGAGYRSAEGWPRQWP